MTKQRIPNARYTKEFREETVKLLTGRHMFLNKKRGSLFTSPF